MRDRRHIDPRRAGRLICPRPADQPFIETVDAAVKIIEPMRIGEWFRRCGPSYFQGAGPRIVSFNASEGSGGASSSRMKS